MRKRRRCLLLSWSVLIAGLSLIGCAPAYHDYADCYIDCRYCAPPPLPYAHYEGCVCHACVATPYLEPAANVQAVPPVPLEEGSE